MHVLIASHDLYPDPGSGGTGRYVSETAGRLADRGHRVSVVTRRRGDVPTRERLDGVDVYRYDVSVAERTAPEMLPSVVDAAAAVSTQVAECTAAAPVDLLSFQGPLTSLLVDRCLDDSVPRVATFHSPWPTEYEIRTRGETGRSGLARTANSALRHRLEGRLLSSADRVVTLSEFMRETCERTYGSAPETRVVPGGVDPTEFAPRHAEDGLAEGEPAFLTVRRLSERMGHDRLFRAFSRIRDRHPGARLYVAGDGPLRARLESTADALGIADGTTFLGYVPDERLPALYASADVFVLPTTELEGFGLATLEALASATPAVATPVGGTVEILSPLDADPELPAPVLLPSADADALADGLAAWADVSAAAPDAAGERCREYVRDRYTWDAVTDRVEDCYWSVQ